MAKETKKTVYASDVIPFFDHWKLVLGDGNNAGFANNFENKDFFYTTKEGASEWVVFKSPNGGDTHGTSNNTRTELAQVKKWYPKTANEKLTLILLITDEESPEPIAKNENIDIIIIGNKNSEVEIYNQDNYEQIKRQKVRYTT